jgi:hypothetical protein
MMNRKAIVGQGSSSPCINVLEYSGHLGTLLCDDLLDLLLCFPTTFKLVRSYSREKGHSFRYPAPPSVPNSGLLGKNY